MLVGVFRSHPLRDSLFELDLDFGGELENERLTLQESEKLGVWELRLQLIPYCCTEKQQVQAGYELHLDVTHGFRLYLSRVRNALAHGVKSDDKDIRKMIADAVTLRGRLKSLFKSVFA